MNAGRFHPVGFLFYGADDDEDDDDECWLFGKHCGLLYVQGE